MTYVNQSYMKFMFWVSMEMVISRYAILNCCGFETLGAMNENGQVPGVMSKYHIILRLRLERLFNESISNQD